MAGLQAHDFEAYQEMLAEKQGADGGRYEAISKFLTETEEYLNRLAGKVAHVRAGQQAAEAQAKAIAEAIAQVGAPDVTVRLTANGGCTSVQGIRQVMPSLRPLPQPFPGVRALDWVC